VNDAQKKTKGFNLPMLYDEFNGHYGTLEISPEIWAELE